MIPPNPDDSEAADAVLPPQERLVLRPALRRAGYALLLAGCVATGWLVYELGCRHGEAAGYAGGHAVGYESALGSGRVSAQLNDLAVRNLLAIMRVAAMSDRALLDYAAEATANLSWIREPAVLQEACWQVVQALLQRGFLKEAQPLLGKTLHTAPDEVLWARRAQIAADLLRQGGELQRALDCERIACSRYRKLGMAHEELLGCYRRLDLLGAITCPPETTMAGLDELQAEAAELGEAGQPLLADLLVFRGVLLRRSGDEDSALQCFRSVLSVSDPDAHRMSPTLAVSYGEALVEWNRVDEATDMLEKALPELGSDPADLPYRLRALRSLAQIEANVGHYSRATALLHQAYGAAEGRLPLSDSFWISLTDQRGWASYLDGRYDEAAQDFAQCLKLAQSAEETIQPLEGLGRCRMAQGNFAEAADLLRRSFELRDRISVGSAEEKADILFLLACCEESQGHSAEALAAYENSLSRMRTLQQPSPARMEDLLRGMGYAAMKLGDWAKGRSAWQALTEIEGITMETQTEAVQQLNICERKLGIVPSSDAAKPTPDEAESAS